MKLERIVRLEGERAAEISAHIAINGKSKTGVVVNLELNGVQYWSLGAGHAIKSLLKGHASYTRGLRGGYTSIAGPITIESGTHPQASAAPSTGNIQ